MTSYVHYPRRPPSWFHGQLHAIVPRVDLFSRLRDYQELSVSTSGYEAVVPITVKPVSPELQFSHLLSGNLDPCGIGIRVKFALHRQPGCCRGGGDEVDDDLMTDQRLAAPILANEREQSVFNLVPLAGARRKVAN